ncbi:MAG: T9SS type A sorting domain-containing protein [Candidatus Eiseniibacteriota bacterium]
MMRAAAFTVLSLAASAAAAASVDDFDALIAEGILCPVERARPVPSSTQPAPASFRAAVPSARVERADDLVTIVWKGVSVEPVSAEIPIAVEEGTVGLMIRADAPNDRFRIAVELLGPDGSLLACEACPDAPAVGEVREGRGTTQMPSTDRAGWELEPGRYSFRVRATPALDGPLEDGTVVDVTATLRSDAGVVVQRFLDLHFVFLPGCGLTTEIAETAPEFAGMLDVIDEAIAPTGIRLGRVTQRNWNRPGFSFISTWDQAGRLFRSSATLGLPRAMNVYCVAGFEAPLIPAVGLSGGIPGPSTNGTPDSGILVRTSPLFTCNDCLPAFGSLFAHEIGHYLGLYHTTEANLARADPFGDTPRCEAPDLRHCPDWDHVMFPVIHAANRTWSPGQIETVRSHPLVYTVPVLRPHATRAEPDEGGFASPNPFRESVEIRFAGSTGTDARVVIHDVSGRRVRDLGRVRDAVSWDGRGERGEMLPAGVYFARVSGEGASRVVRIVRSR